MRYGSSTVKHTHRDTWCALAAIHLCVVKWNLLSALQERTAVNRTPCSVWMSAQWNTSQCKLFSTRCCPSLKIYIVVPPETDKKELRWLIRGFSITMIIHLNALKNTSVTLSAQHNYSEIIFYHPPRALESIKSLSWFHFLWCLS